MVSNCGLAAGLNARKTYSEIELDAIRDRKRAERGKLRYRVE
jgi:hypothetical protein